MRRLLSRLSRPRRGRGPAPLAPARRPSLEALEARLMPASVFVVPTSVPADPSHFYSLAAALPAAGPGGTVTLEPGATPDPGPVAVTQASVFIQGDPGTAPPDLPAESFSLGAAGVTLFRLNLTAVTIDGGIFSWRIFDSVVGALTQATPSSLPVEKDLEGNRITGPVTLAGGSFLINNNSFVGSAGVLLSLTDTTGASVEDNTFRGTADGQTAVAVQAAGSYLFEVNRNAITLPGTGPGTTGILFSYSGGDTGSATASDNTIVTGAGRGIVLDIGTASDAATQVIIEDNDLHGNAVGVEYDGNGGATLGTVLGGDKTPQGGLHSKGRNNFRGFTAAGTPTAAAVVLRGVAPGATLLAQGNLFADGVDPQSVVFSAAGASVDTSSPLAGARAYVQALYYNVLGRIGGDDELNFWVGVLNTQGPAAVAYGVSTSDEGLTKLVDRLFNQYLGRSTRSPQESGFFVQAIRNGSTVEQVTSVILSSTEYRLRAGADLVGDFYRDLVGRDPDAAGRAYWAGVLASQGAGAVADGFQASAEYRGRLVQALYAGILHRTAGPDEVSLWAGSGLPALNIEAAILASPEAVKNI